VVCEICKAISIGAILAGAVNMVDAGEATTGSSFFVAIILLVLASTGATLGRVIVAIKLVLSSEGLTTTNFNSEYFGTADPNCPIAQSCTQDHKPTSVAPEEGAEPATIEHKATTLQQQPQQHVSLDAQTEAYPISL